MRLEGAIFDLDGTLTDSMDIWDRAPRDLVRQFGASPPAHLAEDIFSYIQAHREWRCIGVVFSGDTGFYSGAKKLEQLLSVIQQHISRQPAPDLIGEMLQEPADVFLVFRPPDGTGAVHQGPARLHIGLRRA